MIVVIENNSKIKLENVSELERQLVVQGMSIELPQNHSTGFGGNQEKRYMCKINKSSLRTAITFLPRIYKICVDNGLPLTIHDARPPVPPYKLPPEYATADMLTGVTLTDYQLRAIKETIVSDFGIISSPTGSGKCLGKNTPVMMFDKSVKMVQDIVVGDKLMGDDGYPRNVLSTCYGIDNLYKVSQSHGCDYIVNKDHILSLKTVDGNVFDIPVLQCMRYAEDLRNQLKGYKALNIPWPLSDISIQYVGPGEYYGFQIDGNRRFLLGDFTVTHNTELIAALTKMIIGNVVILGDMQVVVSQITERLGIRGVSDDIGMFFAGHSPNGQSIVVGSVQSLIPPRPLTMMPVYGSYESEEAFNKAYKKWESRKKALDTRAARQKVLEAYIKRAQALIVDEVDTSGNDMFRNVIQNMFNGRIRIGLSGTPFDPLQPVNNFNIEENCGPIISKVSRKEVEAAGRIVPCRYIMLDFQPPGCSIHDASCYDIAENVYINENPHFHGLVLSAMKLHKGEKNVVLVKSIALGEHLKRILEEEGFSVHYVHGATPMKTRNKVFKDFEEDKIDILIGSKIIHRALDLKGGIDNLFIAVDTKLSKSLWQMIGRALRKNKRGYSTIYGVLFRCNKHLYKHSKSHLQQLIDSEYDCYVSFGDKLFSGQEFVARNFQPPRSSTTKQGGIEERFLFHK